MFQSKLDSLAEGLLEDGYDPLDLRRLLTKQHIVMDRIERMLDQVLEGEEQDLEKVLGVLERVLALLLPNQQEAGKNIERVERIRASQAWTNAEVTLLMLQMKAFIEFLPPEQLPRFRAMIEASASHKAGLPALPPPIDTPAPE